MRLQFDSNVCNAYHEWAAVSGREPLTIAFQSRRLRLHTTLEFFAEILGIVRTKRRDVVETCAAWLLDIMESGRVLNPYRQIVEQEVKGRDKHIFAPDSVVRGTKDTLEEVANRRQPTGIDVLLEQEDSVRADDHNEYRLMQERVRTETERIDRQAAKRMTLDEFNERHGNDLYRQALEGICEQCGVKDPHQRSREILENPGANPYTTLYLKCFVAHFYFCFMQDSRLDAGDMADLGQLVYMVGLDWMITNERRIREIWDLVSSTPDRIKSSGELVEYVKPA